MSNRIELNERVIQKFTKRFNLNDQQRQLLSEVAQHLDAFDIAKPLIVSDLKAGIYSCEGIAADYGATYAQVRNLGVKMGVYKRKEYEERKFLQGVSIKSNK